MTIKLHAFPLSPRAFKVLFTAHQLGIAYEFVLVNFATQDQKKPGFTAMNPNQRMPVLDHDGYHLWESNAIVQYLASLKPESGYLPADLKQRMDAVKWQFWESAHWDPACAILVWERFVKGMFGRGEPDPVEVEKGLAQFHRAAKVLDAHLKGRKFLCGDHLSVADFSVAAALIMAEKAQFPLEEYGEIRRWYAGLSALPAWQKTLADSQAMAAAA